MRIRKENRGQADEREGGRGRKKNRDKKWDEVDRDKLGRRETKKGNKVRGNGGEVTRKL